MNRITPFVKRMRTNGGTIYTFSSAVEDIGLNINERNNVVKISNFALLNIPKIDQPSDASFNENRFNVDAIQGAWKYNNDSPTVKDGRVLIAESFENYALNLESNLLNQSSYDATLQTTVSERVFWKWLKETGAIRWTKNSSNNWSEELDADGSLGYNSVVKYLGQVSAGNVRSDSFGTYNETYILVPTSHGQMSPYFQQIEDTNYKHGMEIGIDSGLGANILGREGYTKPHPDGLDFRAYYDFADSDTIIDPINPNPYTMYDNGFAGAWYAGRVTYPKNAYFTDTSTYIALGDYSHLITYDNSIGSVINFKRSRVDCMSLIWNLDTLKSIYGDSNLTYDKMAIDYAINDAFEFNAVLIYYTVYNSTQDTVLATNLLGILFIDAPSGNSSNIGFGGILLPALEKIQSGPGGFGTNYSLRLNIKTDNMIDDTAAVIVDAATADQLYVEDWNQAFYELEKAVNILTQNNSTLNYISSQYGTLQSNQTQIYNDLKELGYIVNDIGIDIKGQNKTIAMFSDGDDPLVESSIYMDHGKIGFFKMNPEYDIDILGTAKTDNLIISQSIKDTSGNILLSYGSPLQLGDSSSKRDIAIYTGYKSSPLIYMDNSVGIKCDLHIDGSVFHGTKIVNIDDPSDGVFKWDLSTNKYRPYSSREEAEGGLGSYNSHGKFYYDYLNTKLPNQGQTTDTLNYNGPLRTYALYSHSVQTEYIFGSTFTFGPDSEYEPVNIFSGQGSFKRFLFDSSVYIGSSWHGVQDDNLVMTKSYIDKKIVDPSDGMFKWDIAGHRYRAYNSYAEAGGTIYSATGKWHIGSIPPNYYADPSYNYMMNYNGVIRGNAIYGITGLGIWGQLYMALDTDYNSLNHTISADGAVFDKPLYYNPDSAEILESCRLTTKDYVDTTKESSLGNPSSNGMALISTASGIRSWVALTGDVGKAYVDGSLATCLRIGNSISLPGEASAHRNGSIFAYTTSGTPNNGTLLTVGGLITGSYPLQINSDYSAGNSLVFRTRNDDFSPTPNWNPWHEIFHDGKNITFLTGNRVISTVSGSSLSLSSGAGLSLNTSGVITLQVGVTSGGSGNAVNINAGNTSYYGAGIGGAVNINAGVNTNMGNGGSIKLAAGNGSAGSGTRGGAISISSGNGTNNGGDVSIFSGHSGYASGNISILTGDASYGVGTISLIGGKGSLYGGTIIIKGGDGGSSGGGINIYGGGPTTFSPVHISCISSADKGNVRLPHGSASIPSIVFRADTQTGFFRSGSGMIGVATSGIENFRFDTSTFYATGDIVGFYTMPSDIKLKTNIIKIENGLDKILSLEGIQYELIKNIGTKHFGFIAQEVEKVIPEIVIEHKLIGDENSYKTIRYAELIPYLVESIKELKTLIEKQDMRIEELQSKLKQ